MYFEADQGGWFLCPGSSAKSEFRAELADFQDIAARITEKKIEPIYGPKRIIIGEDCA